MEREEKETKRGIFIAIEGIDGTGKTTLANALREALDESGTPAARTGELNEVLKALGYGRLCPETEALLYMADRAERTDYVRKMLDNGITVITDRYEASTLAYQEAALGIGARPWLQAVCDNIGIRPDVTILLDMDVNGALKRVRARGVPSKYEEAVNLEKVRQIYLRLAKERGYYIVDASKSEKEVLAEVLHILRIETSGRWWEARRIRQDAYRRTGAGV